LEQARKCADAPTTLAIIHPGLTGSLSAFRDALPPMATATVAELVAEGTETPLATGADHRPDTENRPGRLGCLDRFTRWDR